MKKTIILALYLISLLCFYSEAKSLPVELFAKQAQFKSLKLSPDGKHFAATVPQENTTVLVVINRETMKPIINYGFGEFEHISQFYWLNNQRLVYTKSYQRSDQEKKVSKGEIFAANIDGSKRIQLFGSKSSNSKLKSKRALSASGKLLHILPNDKEHILVLARKFGDDTDSSKKIYRVNAYTQKRQLITKTPLGNINIILTAEGQPFIASGKDRKGRNHRYFYKNTQWQEINKNDPLNQYSFLSVNADASVLYLKKSLSRKQNKTDTSGLFQYSLSDKKITLLYNHPTVDIASFIREPASKTIVGVKTMLDGVKYHYLNPDNAYSKIHQQIANSFPDQDISLYANAMSDNEIIIKTSSDKNPGDYYLFNQQQRNISYLVSKKPWLDPKLMMPKKAISFTARDGQTIYGYLTLPVNKNNTPHPLIVDVHGGPYGVQDKWHFNTDAQLYSNNGYAVLQINFRGSGGYGKHYKKSAYLKRDSLIQHDIIDGTRWALNLENIDTEKVCIVGGSFGGYSALMSPLIEPELYKCAILRYGPYDLIYQMTHADYMSKDSVSVGAMKKYGDNEKIWYEQSPLTYIDKLKTPLMIVTGGKDTRVPPQSAFNLQNALEQRNINYEWLYKAKEGHGFSNPENKAELYKKSLAFIGKYISLK